MTTQLNSIKQFKIATHPFVYMAGTVTIGDIDGEPTRIFRSTSGECTLWIGDVPHPMSEGDYSYIRQLAVVGREVERECDESVVTYSSPSAAITERLVEQNPTPLGRTLDWIKSSEVAWGMALAIRVALCVYEIWLGIVYTQAHAHNNIEATLMAAAVAAVIYILLSPKRGN